MADVGQVAEVIAVVAAIVAVFYVPLRYRRSIRRSIRTGRRDRWTTPQIPEGTHAYGTMSPSADYDLGKPGTTRTSTRDRHGQV